MVEYTVINALAAFVGVLFLANGYYLVRKGREAVALFVASLLVGSGLLFVALFPNTFQVIATVLGLELKARAILVVSNLTLFVLVIYLLNRLGKLNDRVSRLNEQVSLLKTDRRDRADE